VAFLAGSFRRPVGQLSLVEIAVAIAAGAEFEGVARFARRVALVTGNREMFPFQRITGLAVIEIRLIGHAPAAAVVAALAVRSKFSLMGVVMAIEAAIMGDPGKLQVSFIVRRGIVNDRLVAFGA